MREALPGPQTWSTGIVGGLSISVRQRKKTTLDCNDRNTGNALSEKEQISKLRFKTHESEVPARKGP